MNKPNNYSNQVAREDAFYVDDMRFSYQHVFKQIPSRYTQRLSHPELPPNTAGLRGTMIIYLHNNCRGDALFPGVVAEGFSQRMARNSLPKTNGLCGGA